MPAGSSAILWVPRSLSSQMAAAKGRWALLRSAILAEAAGAPGAVRGRDPATALRVANVQQTRLTTRPAVSSRSVPQARPPPGVSKREQPSVLQLYSREETTADPAEPTTTVRTVQFLSGGPPLRIRYAGRRVVVSKPRHA